VVEHFPSKCEVLSSNPHPPPKKKKKEEEEVREKTKRHFSFRPENCVHGLLNSAHPAGAVFLGPLWKLPDLSSIPIHLLTCHSPS
jgi:hypothetical protein